MEGLFLSVLNMSLTASYVIAAIILTRLFLKKAPKVISYMLWAVAGFRLVFPFSFESVFSLIPFKTTPIPADIAMQPMPRGDSGIIIVDNAVSRVLPAATPAASVSPLQIWQAVGAYLWLAGIAVMLIYSVVSIILLKHQLHGAVLTEGNICEADSLKTPFVLGIFSPRIYIPAGLTAEEKVYIIQHEKTHIRGFDHIIKPFAFFILSIHWFNPLVWIAFLLMSSDMELSCDERVIKEMGNKIKKAYSTSLLSLAMGKRILNGSPLAFGEGNVKGPIKNVLNYRKSSFWIILSAVIAVVVVSISLLANPKNDGFTLNNETLSFKSTETNLIKLGTIAFDEYMSSLTSEKMPVNERIASYKLNDISLLAGDINEFCVSLNYDFTTDNDNYVNPARGAKGKGTWSDNYLEIRVKKIGKDAYEIVSVGAGGGGQGLSPVENSVSYELIKLVNGDVLHTISPLSGDNAKLVEDIIMNYMIKSAAWPGVDIMTLKECYLLHATHSGGTLTDYYAYLHDGKAVVQIGEDGLYSLIDDGLYEKLVKLIESSTTTVGGTDGPLEVNVLKQTTIEPTYPEWSPEQSIGVGMASLDYASDDIVIFHGYFGLFVYDLNSLQIIRSLDLKPLNCDATQGSNFCEVSVSMDGNTVQLHPMSSDTMYVYTVSDNILRETTYERMRERFGSNFVPIEDVIDSEKLGVYSYHAVKFDTGEYGYLHTYDWTLSTLSYVRGDMMYALFGK